MTRLEWQVSSFELSKRLQELQVKQESEFYWRPKLNPPPRFNGKEWTCQYELLLSDKTLESCISAFTVAELGQKFPNVACLVYTCNLSTGKAIEWRCIYAIEDRESVLTVTHQESAETEADARAKMLIYLIEKGIINPEKIQ